MYKRSVCLGLESGKPPSHHSDVAYEVRQVLSPVVDAGEPIDALFAIQDGQVERTDQLQAHASNGPGQLVKKLPFFFSVVVTKRSNPSTHKSKTRRVD